jgi:hypothetical protein
MQMFARTPRRNGMGKLRNYTFELCWLLVVILLYALAPARTSANTFSYEDSADDCPEVSGWCEGPRF